MKSLALTLLLTLLSMPVLAEDGPQLPWVAPEVMAAAVDIGMDDAQRAEFRGAVTDLARGYMDDIRKVMSGRDQTNLKRKIKSKRNSRMKQLDKAMAKVLTEEQMPRYEVYRDLLEDKMSKFPRG